MKVSMQSPTCGTTDSLSTGSTLIQKKRTEGEVKRGREGRIGMGRKEGRKGKREGGERGKEDKK